jgi:hypothetical protein
MAGDPRLDRAVTVSVEGMAVAELLERLSAKTGIALAAAPDLGQEKVIAFGRNRPLRELLADLATLFNNRWRREKRGGELRYVMDRDAAARQHEELLVRAELERLLARFQAQLQALPLTPAELAAQPREGLSNAFLSDPDMRPALELAALLDSRQRERLLSRGRLSIPLAALGGPHRDKVRDLLGRRLAAEQAFFDSPEGQALGPKLTAMRRGFADIEKGAVRFRAHRTGGYRLVGMEVGTRRFDAQVREKEGGGDSLVMSGWPIALLETSEAWLLPPHGNPYTGEPVAAAAMPAVEAIRQAGATRALGDRLRHLARATGRPVLADFYRCPPVARPVGAAAGTPVEERMAALDAVCRPAGYLWWMRGETLLLRKRDWYTQRLYEVPDTWLTAVTGRLRAQEGRLTFGDLYRLLELTERQLVGLTSLAEAHAEDTDQIVGLPELLAVLRAGTPANAPVLHGQPSAAERRRSTVTFERLNAAQRRLLPAFLAEQDRHTSPEDALGFGVLVYTLASQKPADGLRVTVEWTLASEPTRVVWLPLPAAVPDDRRESAIVD